MKNIIYIFLIIIVIISCEQEDEYLPPEFNYPIPEVDITENVWVGAFYYNYSQEDWDEGYSYTPVLGEYSVNNTSTISQHRGWADDAGIDFLILEWNGFEDDELLNNFISSRSENVKMVINYNTAHIKATNSSPLEGEKLNTMIEEIKTLATKYFAGDYYFKNNNQPVLIFKPINLSSNISSSIDFNTVVQTLRSELQASGVDIQVIGEITSGWLPPQRYSEACKVFDGIVLSDWKTEGNYGYDQAVFFPAFMDQAFKNWNDSTIIWGIDFIPCIMPGFDDKIMSPSSKVYNVDRSVDLYKDMCNVAKRNLGSSRIITINSWNNFKEGTSIEPTEEYNDDYLIVTKEQFSVQ